MHAKLKLSSRHEVLTAFVGGFLSGACAVLV